MRTPRLVYQQRALSLIDDAARSSGVQIVHEGRTFPRITKTYVVMWNVGRLIQATDIDAADSLRFEVSSDAEIVGARVMKSSNHSNVSVSREKSNAANAVTVTFDELGPGDGAVIEILHTSPDRFGVLLGAIRGMAAGPQDRGPLRRPFNPLPSQVPAAFKAIGTTAFVLIFGIGALLVLLSAFGPHLALRFGPHVGPVMTVIESVSDVIYAVLALMLLAQMRRRFPEDLAIPELAD
jgi:hypothetical protein